MLSTNGKNRISGGKKSQLLPHSIYKNQFANNKNYRRKKKLQGVMDTSKALLMVMVSWAYS